MPLTPPRLGHPGRDQDNQDDASLHDVFHALGSVHTSTTPLRKERRPPPPPPSRVAAKTRPILAAKSKAAHKSSEELDGKRHLASKHLGGKQDLGDLQTREGKIRVGDGKLRQGDNGPSPAAPLKEQYPRKSNIRELRKYQAVASESCRQSLASEASSGGMYKPIQETLKCMGLDSAETRKLLLETTPDSSATGSYCELPGTAIRAERYTSLLTQTDGLAKKDSAFSFGENSSSPTIQQAPVLNVTSRLSVQESFHLGGNLRQGLKLVSSQPSPFRLGAVSRRRRYQHRPRRLEQLAPVEITESSFPVSLAIETTDSTVIASDERPKLACSAPDGPVSAQLSTCPRSITFNPQLCDIFKKGIRPPDITMWEGGKLLTDIEPKHVRLLNKMNKESQDFINFCLRLKRLVCPNALLADYLARVDRHKVWALMRLTDLLPELGPTGPLLRGDTVDEAVQTEDLPSVADNVDDPPPGVLSVGVGTTPASVHKITSSAQVPSPVKIATFTQIPSPGKWTPHTRTAAAQTSPSKVASRPHMPSGPETASVAKIASFPKVRSPDMVSLSNIASLSPAIHERGPDFSPTDPSYTQEFSTAVEASDVTPTPLDVSGMNSVRETPQTGSRSSVTPLTSMSSILYSKRTIVVPASSSDLQETPCVVLETEIEPLSQTAPLRSPPTHSLHLARLSANVQPGSMAFVVDLFKNLSLEHLRQKHKQPHRLTHISDIFSLYASMCETMETAGSQINEICQSNNFGKYSKFFERGDWVLRRKCILAIGKYLNPYRPALMEQSRRNFGRDFYIEFTKDHEDSFIKMNRGESLGTLASRATYDHLKQIVSSTLSPVLTRVLKSYLIHRTYQKVNEMMKAENTQLLEDDLVKRIGSRLQRLERALPEKKSCKLDLNETALASAASKYRAEIVSIRRKRLQQAEARDANERAARVAALEITGILGHSGRVDISSLLSEEQRRILYARTGPLPWIRYMQVGDDLLRPLKPVPPACVVLGEGNSPTSASPSRSWRSRVSLGATSPQTKWTPPLTEGGDTNGTPTVPRLSVEWGNFNLSDLLLNFPTTPASEGSKRRISVVSSIDR
eukprot:Gregarina_sp_Poly_1__3258@NODE_192_length_11628_cov_113_656085_g171_i0_p1_GENE_NODE_192_length_11628_cov_113_656085_g171_i0NODE_192_length_11628_cov_113_656085_g171_i0_p1_ORF_typecomplete_len1083_score160_28_NODE_192_length_11628_cov_113_656085_g171_i024125660